MNKLLLRGESEWEREERVEAYTIARAPNIKDDECDYCNAAGENITCINWIICILACLPMVIPMRLQLW